MTASIVADVQLRTDGVTRGVSTVQGKLRGLASSTGSIFKGALGAGAVLGVVGKVGDALASIPEKVGEVRDAGSALQQSTGAVEAVFGKYAAGIKKSATEAEQSLGLSKNEYQELASTLGAGLKNQGITDFAKKTKDVTKLGADLSAQFGGSTREAVEAIGSLMRGEADPIEKYGVSIKESAIAAELAAKGQSKLKGSALEQAKSQARLSLLFKQTKDAQGAFAREGGSLANVQQRNAAAMENLKARLGTSLLPVFTAGANMISTKVLPILDRVVSWASANLPSALAAAQAALAPVFGFVQQLGGQLAGLVSGGGISAFAAQLQPVGAALMGVFSGVGAVIRAVIPIVLQVLGAIVGAVRANLPALQAAYTSIGSTLSGVASIITSVWQKIGPIVLPIVTSVFGTVVQVISGALKIVSGIVQTVAAVLRGDWTGALNGIKSVTQGVWQIVSSVIKNAVNSARAVVAGVAPGIARAIVGAWNAVKSATTSAWNAVVSAVAGKISALLGKVRGIQSSVKGALSGVGSWLRSAGANLVQGFINGVSGSIGAVVNKAREIATAAIKAVKGALGIQSPSRVFRQIGAFVGAGFARGIQGSTAQVKSAINKMAGLARKAGGARGRAISRALNVYDDRVLKIAKARAVATAKLSAAQAKLNDLIKARTDYAAQVSGSAQQYASLGAIEADRYEGQSAANLVQGLQDRYNAVAGFRDKLAQLTKLGLNQTSFDQLVQAGVEGGTDRVAALLAGGQEAVRQVNVIQANISRETAALGSSAASGMYDAGIRAQAGLVRGLAANNAALAGAAKTLANQLVAAVKRALKIKSPSRVFTTIGDQVTRGLVIGLDDRAAAKAAGRLARGVEDGFGSPRLAASSAGGATVVQIDVKVSPLSNPAEVGRAVVGAIKDYQSVSGRRVLVA